MGLLMILELLSAVAQEITLSAAELGSFVVVEAFVYRQIGCKKNHPLIPSPHSML